MKKERLVSSDAMEVIEEFIANRQREALSHLLSTSRAYVYEDLSIAL